MLRFRTLPWVAAILQQVEAELAKASSISPLDMLAHDRELRCKHAAAFEKVPPLRRSYYAAPPLTQLRIVLARKTLITLKDKSFLFLATSMKVRL